MIDIQNMRDPNTVKGSYRQREDGLYEWQMKRGGPLVISEVPLKKFRWWDHGAFHLAWSYSSWTTMILNEYAFWIDKAGHKRIAKALKFPRKYLKSRGWW